MQAATFFEDESPDSSDSDSSDFAESEISTLRRLVFSTRFDHAKDYARCLSYSSRIVRLPEHDYVDIAFRGIIQTRILTRAYADGRWETERHRLAKYVYGAMADIAEAMKSLEEIASGAQSAAVPPHVAYARFRIPNLFPQILNARGFILKILGFDLPGEGDFTRAIEMDSGYVVARRNRAILYESCGLFELALRDYDEAIRLQPQVPAAYQNRGRLHMQLGNYADALPDLFRAEKAYEVARMLPVVAAIRWRLAFSLFHLHRWDLAEEKLRVSHDLAPGFPKFTRDLGCMDNLAMDFFQFLPQVQTCKTVASALSMAICEFFQDRVEVLRFLVNWEFGTKCRINFRSRSEGTFLIPFLSLL